MQYFPSSKQEEEFLKNFDPSKYQNPAVAADTALFCAKADGLFILLIERGGWPYKGCWALPGGFVNIDEDLADSAKRELKEETDIDIDVLEQAAVWGRPDRDPRQRVITVSFIALIDEENMNAKAGDDAGKAEWFRISAYKKTVGSEETQIDFSLSGPIEISASVKFPNQQIQKISCLQSGGLAFDHAESIALSTELLKSRAEIITEKSLGKQKAANAAKSIKTA